MIQTRPCPGYVSGGNRCKGILRPVVGGLGKMGSCARCGWTGPLKAHEVVPSAGAAPTLENWEFEE